MFSTLKSELKERAVELRAIKAEVKKLQREHAWDDLWRAQYRLTSQKWVYRHKHIAYCLLRGRTMEQIERKCHTPPCESTIKNYVEEYGEEVKDAA